MSTAVGKQQISDLIASKFVGSALNKAITTDFRHELDQYLAVVDISKPALAPNNIRVVSRASFDASYERFKALIDAFFPASRQFTSIDALEEAILKKTYNIDKRGVVLISGSGVYALVGKNFNSIRAFISTQVSNKLEKDPFFGKTTKYVHYSDIATTIEEFNATGFAAEYRARNKLPDDADILNKSGFLTNGVTTDAVAINRSVLDIGHMFDTGNILYQTPLAAKLSAVKDLGSFSPGAVQAAASALSKLQSVHAEMAFTYQNQGISAKGQIAGRATLALTLHHWKLNNRIARKESEIYRKFLNDLAIDALGGENFLKISGSNTLLQDIAEHYTSSLSGKPKRIPAHGKIAGDSLFIINGKRRNVSTPKLKKATHPPLRKLTGQFYSLASLQRLLDATLAQVIKQNMGNGSRKDILNLRSGRFAESAKVERMSQSREGMITAFYSYMKNPYQTFEPGFRQGSPASRNPKLLISKSIREIAATQVANRMRAVSV